MRPALSIRTHLFLLALIVALPFIGLLAYTTWHHTMTDMQRASNISLSIAQATAAHTEQFIVESGGILAQLAERPLVRAMDPGRCDPFFDEALALNPAFTNIGLINLDGRVICSALPLAGSEPVSVAEMSWFQNAKRAGRFRVGEPHVGPITGKWASALTQPVRDDAGNLVGILAMTIDLTRFQNVFAGASLPPGSVIKILDSEGTVIARSVEPEKWVGRNLRGAEIVDLAIAQREGQAQTRGVDGVERIYGFTAIPSADWHAYAGLPADVVFAPVRARIMRAAFVGLVLLVVAARLGYRLSQSIVQPIAGLAATARAIARGEKEARATPTGAAEVVEVAVEFNRMVDTLRASEARFVALVEQLPAAVYTARPDAYGSTLYISPYIETLLGFPAAEWVADPTLWYRQLHPEDRARVLAANARSSATGTPFREEYRLLARDGRIVWVRDEARVLVTAAGEPLLQGLLSDITERKHMEQALRESQQKYTLIFEKAPYVAALARLSDEIIVEVNEEFEKTLGYSRQEVLGKTSFELNLYPDPEARKQAAALVKQKGFARDMEIQVRTKSGRLCTLLFNTDIIEIGGEKYYLAMARDITARRQAEEALRVSEERLKHVLENAPDTIYTLDLTAGKAVFLNREEFCGYSRAELEAPGSILYALHPEDLGVVRKEWEQGRQGKDVAPISYRLRKKDGTWAWIEQRTRIMSRNPDGSTKELLVSLTDITERKQAEEALARTERIYREAITQAGGVPYYRDYGSTGYAFMGAEIVALTGYTAEEMTGPLFTSRLRRIESYGPDRDLPHEERVRRARCGLIKEWHEDYLFEKKDGTLVWLSDHAVPVYDPSGQPIGSLGILMDITGRKRAEEELRRRADDLAALNALATQVSRTLDLDEVATLAVDGILQAVRPDLVFLSLRAGERLLQKSATSADIEIQCASELEHRVGGCICGLAVGEGRPIYSRDIGDDLRCIWAECKRIGIRSCVALPLRSGEEVIGILVLAARQERDFEAQAPFLETVAAQVAVGLRNALLYDQVQRYAGDLERKVAERTVELTAKNRELEAFAYSVSHDLKAPLRGIDGYSSLLLRDHADRLDEEGKQFLINIRAATMRMAQLIDGLLDYARLERRAFAIGPTAPLPLIQAVIAERAAEIKERGIELTIAVLICNITIVSSRFFSACTAPKNTPARASAWPSCARRWSAWAAVSGPRARPDKGRPFSWSCRNRG